jgi:hypothetical protein
MAFVVVPLTNIPGSVLTIQGALTRPFVCNPASNVLALVLRIPDSNPVPFIVLEIPVVNFVVGKPERAPASALVVFPLANELAPIIPSVSPRAVTFALEELAVVF